MLNLSKNYIQNNLADSQLIFHRGEDIYQHGSYYLAKGDIIDKNFQYEVDGTYGFYTTTVHITDDAVVSSCSCPYPGNGCKHVVAAALNARDILLKHEKTKMPIVEDEDDENPYLNEDEIRLQALEDRKKRAKSESFEVIQGEMYKGEHIIINKAKKKYTVTLHDPMNARGHCTCPDYLTNCLGTCKHIEFLVPFLTKQPGFKKKIVRENFPFIDIYWDSLLQQPKLFKEDNGLVKGKILEILFSFFDDKGRYIMGEDLSGVMTLLQKTREYRHINIRETLLSRVEKFLDTQQIKALSAEPMPEPDLKIPLYPYQKEGVTFGIYKKGVLIGDEMGLGKTIQAISLGILKKEIFGFSKILVVTLASLKEQWKREIEKFTHEQAVIVAGGPKVRKDTYRNDPSLFKITNYEAVLRDVLILSRFKPDIIILDEAQRIKNFSTKTADAVKRIPKKQGLVLTGTPLENKLEDVYSIIQFLDPMLLTPLWQFAANHFMLPRNKKGKTMGYKNLGMLNEKLQNIVIRRKKEEVLKDLPGELINDYFIDLAHEQHEIHSGYMQSLIPLLNKKFLTPMDMQRIQVLLLRMRMVCNSTYLIDRKTHISPKLKELEGIIQEMVLENKRKMVIFSEWTTMTYLIAKHLSNTAIPFVELSGKVPVEKRQNLIDEFTNNPDCRVFLSTDAGGTGLNLQAADCVVNFELPWNPAKLYQRIGRVSRIGQKSKCINVINLIAKDCIEEKIMTGIQLKNDLFKGVFDKGPDTVEFSRKKKNEMLNNLRDMMGEERALPSADPSDPEDIPEDTPYYLNPEVLNRDEQDETPDDSSENAKVPAQASQERSEKIHDMDVPDDDINPHIVHEAPYTDHEASDTGYGPDGKSDDPEVHDNAAEIIAGQTPEKVESILNSGMEFLGGLLEMATGQKMEKSRDQDSIVKIDKNTGEVTMKFKLPGFH